MRERRIISFDVGEKRIGVARAIVPPRITQPLKTLLNDASLPVELQQLIQDEQPDVLVVGLPRNQSGQETAQTEYVRDWVQRYLFQLGIPIIWQDESLTSVLAEQQLESYARPYKKEDIDAMAAALILSDYLEGMQL